MQILSEKHGVAVENFRRNNPIKPALPYGLQGILRKVGVVLAGAAETKALLPLVVRAIHPYGYFPYRRLYNRLYEMCGSSPTAREALNMLDVQDN